MEKCEKGGNLQIVLDRTPFYAESGGQVGDAGEILVGETARVRITDVQKIAGGSLFLHQGTVEEGTVSVGDKVECKVDEKYRNGCKVHHTSTHLLQSALKTVLGDDVCQSGSLVKPDYLRFDFNYPKALEEAQVKRVEGMMNEWIAEKNHVVTQEMPMAEAKKRGATAMFGEKYGDVVRVVDVVSEVSALAEIVPFPSPEGVPARVPR